MHMQSAQYCRHTVHALLRQSLLTGICTHVEKQTLVAESDVPAKVHGKLLWPDAELTIYTAMRDRDRVDLYEASGVHSAAR